MIFESINYWFALQDFIFSMAAGFVTGFIYQLLSVVLYGNKIAVFVKDIIICFIFAVVIFSYVVSFTNYPIIRIYHILGGFLGFLCFPFRFSIYLQKIFFKIFSAVKNKMLCYSGKVLSIICDRRPKRTKSKAEKETKQKEDHLKSEEVLLYNL